MKIEVKFLVVMFVALAVFCVTLASGTVTTFKTGPFTVSVDLGMPCNDINISKPVQAERISGQSYTNYFVKMCDVFMSFTRFDKDTYDLTKPFDLQGVSNTLLLWGVDKDTITVYDRKIDSKPGAVGSGYVPKSDSTIATISYIAAFQVSPKSYCYIYVLGNETKMVSALKTIHVTEAA